MYLSDNDRQVLAMWAVQAIPPRLVIAIHQRGPWHQQYFLMPISNITHSYTVPSGIVIPPVPVLLDKVIK